MFGADDSALACPLHFGAAQSEEAGFGVAAAEFGDDLGAVVIAGGFASGEEEVRIGVCGDEDSLVELQVAENVVAVDLLVGGNLVENDGQGSFASALCAGMTGCCARAFSVRSMMWLPTCRVRKYPQWRQR